MPKLLSSLLMTSMVVTGIYMIALTLATVTTLGFTPAANDRQPHLSELVTVVIRAENARRTAIARCELIAEKEKNSCDVNLVVEHGHNNANLHDLAKRQRDRFKSIAILVTAPVATYDNGDADVVYPLVNASAANYSQTQTSPASFSTLTD